MNKVAFQILGIHSNLFLAIRFIGWKHDLYNMYI